MNVPPAPTREQSSMVFIFHKDWNLVINMMIGIHKATKAVWDADEHILTKNDYKIKDVFQLNYHRSIDEKDTLRGKCHFHSYAPYVFANIRKVYGIDDERVNSLITPVPELHGQRGTSLESDQG